MASLSKSSAVFWRNMHMKRRDTAVCKFSEDVFVVNISRLRNDSILHHVDLLSLVVVRQIASQNLKYFFYVQVHNNSDLLVPPRDSYYINK